MPDDFSHLTDEQRYFLSLSLEERFDLVLKLGQEEIARMMAEHQIDREEAIRRIKRRNSEGRRPSVANRE